MKYMLFFVLLLLAACGNQPNSGQNTAIPNATSMPEATQDFSAWGEAQYDLGADALQPGTVVTVSNGLPFSTEHPAIGALTLNGVQVNDLVLDAGYIILPDNSGAFFLMHSTGTPFCITANVDINLFSLNVNYSSPDGNGVMEITLMLPAGTFCTDANGRLPLYQA